MFFSLPWHHCAPKSTLFSPNGTVCILPPIRSSASKRIMLLIPFSSSLAPEAIPAVKSSLNHVAFPNCFHVFAALSLRKHLLLTYACTDDYNRCCWHCCLQFRDFKFQWQWYVAALLVHWVTKQIFVLYSLVRYLDGRLNDNTWTLLSLR